MKKVALVTIWSGKLPNYFNIWLKSCEFNKTIDFYVITDDRTKYEYPKNVFVRYMEFSEIKKRFEAIFDFPISLERPYKLCDYKPAYGEAFYDLIKDYDYWGYCDIDLIWGDIRKFIPDTVLEGNERIFTRGHCSLFVNNEQVNRYYRTLPRGERLDYKMVYQSPEIWCFDEWGEHCGGGISVILKENGIATYDEPVMADIYMETARFCVNRRKDLRKVSYFIFDRGALRAQKCDKNDEEELVDVLYCHFQKRDVQCKNFDSRVPDVFFFLAPGEFVARFNGKLSFIRFLKLEKYDIIKKLKKIWHMIRMRV